ncbi:Sensor histidine kinase RcsC [Asticcacaulis sp. MM231]|uniref:PAS domain-containing hybrid sensor histidine kinase/response regulator n=1 Tax=Asticcacaulis sp. MM231 TaxID=3157666 RepID=UPI0032D57208
MPLSKLSPSEQADFFRLVLDSTVEGVYTVDCEGRTTSCNAACLTLLGFDATDDVLGLKLHEVILVTGPDGTPYAAEDCPIVETARTGVGRHIPHGIFHRRDGSAFPVEYRAQPIRKDGVLMGAICTFVDISDRVAADEKLSIVQKMANSASERINLALDSGVVLGTWVWDIPHDLVYGDERFARSFSVPEALALKGLPFETTVRAIHPEDIDGLRKAVTEALEGAPSFRAEYRLRDGDVWRWVEASGTVTRNAAGAPVRFPGVLIDIDERKRFEDAFQQTHDQLRMAQKVGGIGVFAMPADAGELTVSEEFCTIFGLAVAPKLSVEQVAKLVVAEDRQARSTDEDRAAGTTPSETEYRIQRPDTGEVRWIYRRAEFIRDDDGKPLHMVGMVQDITERKTAALRLRESQAYLNLMLESVQDYAIISLDEAGRIVLWNAGAQKIFGYKPKDVLEQHIEVIFTPEDCAHGAPRTELALAATNTRASDERWHMRQNGERFYASGTMAAMYDDEGRVKGFIKICRDMTAQQQAQEALLEARNAAEAANIAKTEFLANMSHEIRTPMNAIIGLSTILSKSQPLTSRQTDYIRTLSNSADSLLALINDLLDIAKIEARTVELENIPFSLTRLMQEVTSMMAVSVREKGLTFISDGECVEERVFVGDPTRMRQIIVNLCSNAIKFTELGEVRVAITCLPAEAPDHEIICLTVSDSGIGIAPDKIDSIFHKFVQADTSINRKYGGTGLGLAITRTLVEIMGGSIKVSSAPGEGSIFEVLLPLQVATSDQVARSEYSLAAVQEGRVEKHLRPPVLLVEDYEPNILVATTFLEDFGYNVDIANNGLEAFDAVQRTRYVAVLMDVQMHGMNGLDATKLIREWEAAEDTPRVRIIGMTAHALAGDRERCLSVGMDDYVAKPFRPEELRRKIENAAGNLEA